MNQKKITEKEFQELLNKYTSGEATPDEKNQVEVFYQRNQQKDSIVNLWTDDHKRRIQSDLKSRIWERTILDPSNNASSQNLKAWVLAACVSVLLIATGLVYFFNGPMTEHINAPVADIIKSTARGQKLKVNLPDGSVVQLNAESKIVYQEDFVNHRAITLEGEAFFQVARNPEKPFVVTTGSVETTVLGTSFNINAYPEREHIQVMLATGSVKVENTEEENPDLKGLELIPGQRAAFNKSVQRFSLDEVSIEEEMAWSKGIILFENNSSETILADLSRWYGVEFKLENKPSKKWTYTGRFKNMNLELVLNTIQFTHDFNYEINGDQVTIHFN